MDLACRHHHHCQQCSSMDHGGKCHADRAYAFRLESKNGEKTITCLDDRNGGPAARCRRDLCECDKQMAWHYFLYTNSFQQALDKQNFDKEICHETSAATSGARPPSQGSGYKNVNSDGQPQGQVIATPGHVANQCCGANPNRYPYFSGVEGSERGCCAQMLYKKESHKCCRGSIMNSFDQC